MRCVFFHARILSIALLCGTAFLMTACADLLHKADVAIYGSEEAAKAAKEAYQASENEREAKNQRKMEDKLFSSINELRKRRHLPLFGSSETMQIYARLRANELSQCFDEYRPSGEMVEGEIRASSLIKPETVLTFWLTDMEAQKIILSPFIPQCAVGVTKKGGTYYWVLVTTE